MVVVGSENQNEDEDDVDVRRISLRDWVSLYDHGVRQELAVSRHIYWLIGLLFDAADLSFVFVFVLPATYL